MDDTSPEMKELYFSLLMRKSGSERLAMALDMFNTARALVEASAPKELNAVERKIYILKRFYGNDFTSEEMGRICAHLKCL